MVGCTIRTHIQDAQEGRILWMHNKDAYSECTIRTHIQDVQ